jgi:hypothetical protein
VPAAIRHFSIVALSRLPGECGAQLLPFDHCLTTFQIPILPARHPRKSLLLIPRVPTSVRGSTFYVYITSYRHGGSDVGRPGSHGHGIHTSRGKSRTDDEPPAQTRPLIGATDTRCLLSNRRRHVGLHPATSPGALTGFPRQCYLREPPFSRGLAVGGVYWKGRGRASYVVQTDYSQCVWSHGTFTCCLERPRQGIHR